MLNQTQIPGAMFQLTVCPLLSSELQLRAWANQALLSCPSTGESPVQLSADSLSSPAH